MNSNNTRIPLRIKVSFFGVSDSFSWSVNMVFAIRPKHALPSCGSVPGY